MRKYENIEECIKEIVDELIDDITSKIDDYGKLLSVVDEGIKKGYIIPPPEWAEFFL